MNKIYRVVWNCTLRVYQVCSEHTRRLGKTASVQQAVTVSPGYAALSVKSFRPLPLLVMLALSGTVQAEVLTIDNGDSRTYSNALTVEGVVVGNQTNGTLIITDGGSITSSSRSSVIGAYATGVGTATVQDSGIWNLVQARLSIGDSGTGSLKVLNGGTVITGDTDLGYRTGGKGTLLVDGAGSTLSTAGMYVGRSGNGDMTIRNEGRVTTTEDTIIASGTGVVGAVEVSNNGRWDLINKTGQLPNLNIGYRGTGTLDINSNGSDVVKGFTLGTWEGTADSDRIDVSELLQGSGYTANESAHYINGIAQMDDPNSELLSYLKVTTEGSNTLIQVDLSGQGGDFTTLVTLNGVQTDLATLLANHQLIVG